jgi:ankyrin repeat protein
MNSPKHVQRKCITRFFCVLEFAETRTFQDLDSKAVSQKKELCVMNKFHFVIAIAKCLFRHVVHNSSILVFRISVVATKNSTMSSDSPKPVISTDYESSAAEDFDSYTVSKYENAECALLSYSRTNKLDKLIALLDAKLNNKLSLNLNYKGQQKQNFSWSALHLACYFGHIEVVEQLLAKKQFRKEIDVNIKNNSGDTPLHKAALTDRAEIVQLLLSNGANVFIKNCDGLLAKQLTKKKHISEMLEAAEEADKILIKLNMFKAVDNGDLKGLQEFFQSYDSLRGDSDLVPKPPPIDVDVEEQKNRSTGKSENGSEPQQSNNLPSADFINQMTDDRGNTLLHLAAMRGFKAICVYLLEQGFDPYRKNNLGQTCIDISSHQLRQLFMSVKPANSQLKRLTRDRVTRFEGPLLKKVRILGWKQIYVVLENGVFLLFNNRSDSMNRSRRGYKYLESATCEADPNDFGMFTVSFSDRSKATFLVSSDHLSFYNSFKSSTRQTPSNQVELIRQKWVDSIRDHIVYSTEFIRKGLNFNDDDNYDGSNNNDLSNLNHLLPMDTIKSFFQEARAHYNILERHAESLCNLIQSVTDSSSNAQNVNLENSILKVDADQHSVTSTTTSGSRLFNLIRGSRPDGRTSQECEGNQIQSQQQSMQARSNNLTNEFLQDNWSCIVFHLRLLMESTENTKTTMSQALALMEHQEQLRQNRIQDQEERCRVLEDSLHALARDHHELEKSLSMSQIYHSAPRSISMSTDLNEYHDAFEDFDDEKTMTPDSMPSDDGLEKRIQEVMNEEEAGPASKMKDQQRLQPGGLNDETDDDCDDLESNCSALTVETMTDQYLSMVDTSQCQNSLVPSANSGIQSR